MKSPPYPSAEMDRIKRILKTQFLEKLYFGLNPVLSEKQIARRPTGSFIEESDGLANAILDRDFGNIQNFGGNIAFAYLLFYYSGYWVLG